MNWKPIKDAPKDATIVDLYCANRDSRRKRHTDYRRTKNERGDIFYHPLCGGESVIDDATHFMIIEPPKES